MTASDRFERSGSSTKNLDGCLDPRISRLSRFFSVYWNLRMHTWQQGGGKCDTSDGQKVGTVWLDLLLCLTFSLANEWLGDINRPWKAPSQMCCISFRHQYVHVHNLTKRSDKLTISWKLTQFVKSSDWIGGRLGLKCVLWGMPCHSFTSFCQLTCTGLYHPPPPLGNNARGSPSSQGQVTASRSSSSLQSIIT